MTPAAKFQSHLAHCWQCRTIRFCWLGRELLLTAAGQPTLTVISEHLTRHNVGDVESTLWLREHAPEVAKLFLVK